jgi:hypothetical protein
MYNSADVRVPVAQGADPSQPGQYRTTQPRGTPLLEFARNEAYGGWTNIALTIWSLGIQSKHVFDPNMPESVVEDFRAWHVYGLTYYNYETHHLTIDGLVARGDWSLMQRGLYGGKGLYAGDYDLSHFRLTNSDIQGLLVGIDVGPTVGTTQVIENTYLRNYYNIIIQPQYFYGGAQEVLPRTTVLRNVRFAHLTVPTAWDMTEQSFISMRGQSGGDRANYLARDDVYVYDHNGVAGDDFRLYYREQAGDAVLRQAAVDDSGGQLTIASPTAGLTNTEAWQQYGIAFAGSVAPASATTRDDIDGLLAPI